MLGTGGTDWQFWTAIFGGFTVLLLAIGAGLTYLSYSHARHLSGHHRPVSIKTTKFDTLIDGFFWIQSPEIVLEQPNFYRTLYFQVNNDSDFEQRIRILKTKVLWPRFKGPQPFAPEQLLRLAPHASGIYGLLFRAFEWPSDMPTSPDEQLFPDKRRIFLLLKATTSRGNRIRCRGLSNAARVEMDRQFPDGQQHDF